jgi:outer membrane protein assembly factor BamB
MKRSFAMKTLGWVAFLLAASAQACSSHGSDARRELVGTVEAMITRIPPNVGCVQIVAAGFTTVTTNFDAMPGQSSIFSLSKLPTGSVTFSGSAFNTSCTAIGAPSTATWTADPVMTMVVPGVTGTVALSFRSTGSQIVCANFLDGTDAGGCPEGGGDGGIRPPASSVLQFHNHLNRDGFFVDSAITKVASMTLHKDATFDGTITGNVFATPLYVANGPGEKGAFYVATESNDVYALDEVTGKPVWHRTLGPPVPISSLACGNIKPLLGVTGTPAIDLGTRTIVMDAAIAGMGGAMTHSAFGLSIDDGSVRWSLDLSTVKDPSGNAFGATKTQNQRSAVLVAGGKAYFAFGGHFGDCGVYYGWVIGVPLDGNPTNVRAWRSQVQGAPIWGPGGPASDGMSVFVTTGNGFSMSATPAESEGLLRLGLDLSFTNTNPDFFAPADWKALDNNDLDLGSSGPLLIDAPSIMPSALAMAAGKDGKLYLLDRNNLGGVGAATLGTALMSSGSFIQAGAWANLPGGTFVVVRGGAAGVSCPMGTTGNLIAVRLDPAAQNRMSTVWCADSLGAGSPIISTSDGTNDALVWSAGAEVSNALHAWDLHTGQLVFGGGGAGDAIPNVRHYSSPIVANGRVVVAGDGHVYTFKP